jgi:hypothetical protein
MPRSTIDHPTRSAIQADVLAGVPVRTAAAKHNVSASTVSTLGAEARAVAVAVVDPSAFQTLLARVEEHAEAAWRVLAVQLAVLAETDTYSGDGERAYNCAQAYRITAETVGRMLAFRASVEAAQALQFPGRVRNDPKVGGDA